MFSSKALRSWIASFIFLALVVGLIFFLTFLEIPKQNKDLITSIIGMLVGSMSMAISIFVGRDPDDVAELKGSIEELNDDRNTLIARLRDAQIDKDTLRQQHEHLLNQVVDKLSVFVGREPLEELGKGELKEAVEQWMPSQKTVQFSDAPQAASPPGIFKPAQPPPGPKVNPRDFEEFDPRKKK